MGNSGRGVRGRMPAVVLTACILAAVIPFVALGTASSSSDDAQGMGLGAIIAMVVFLAVVGVAILVLLRNVAGYEPDFDDDRDGARLAVTPEERALLARWLVRARWARGMGGACGVVLWIFGANGQGDVLLMGIGGVSLGAVFAELHRAAPTRPRTAGLDVRSVGTYLDRRGIRSMRLAAAAAVLATIIATALADWTALTWAGAAIVSLLAIVLVQRRVAGRPRPALGPRLRAADDLVRSLAVSRGLAVPGSAIAILLSAHAMLVLADRYDWANAVAVAFWIGSLVMWWRDRGLRLGTFIGTRTLAPA